MGEVVKVQKDGFFPADILLLSTSSDDGICYVETINLDGESNLKIKKALDATKKLDDTGLRDFKVRGISFESIKHDNASLHAPNGSACFCSRQPRLHLICALAFTGPGPMRAAKCIPLYIHRQPFAGPACCR